MKNKKSKFHEVKNACKKGDLALFINLLQDVGDINQGLINDLLLTAVGRQQWQIVRYVVDTAHADVHFNEDVAFKDACYHGHFPTVQWLLTQHHVDIHAAQDYAFRICCEKGHLDIIRYLLTSNELKQHADPHASSDYGLHWAAYEQHIEIVNYLLTNNDMAAYSPFDIHAVEDHLFSFLHKGQREKTLSYLILDYGITLTPDIEKCIKDDEAMKKLFEKRRLYHQLQDNVGKKDLVNKRNIKL